MKRYFFFVIVLGFLLMSGISKGYALDCTGMGPECAWLEANPTISNAIVWEDSSAGPMNYSAWSLSRKAALSTAFQTAWNKGSYGLTDPPANILNLGDNDFPETVLAEGDAWSLYISSIANSLALEIDHRVSWSLLDYSDQDLAILLDSREMFSWSTLYQGYRIHWDNKLVSSVLAPPDFTYSFLVNNAILASDRSTTIERLLDWSRNNFLHFGCWLTSCPNLFSALMMDWTWQYRGWPPVSRKISGTVNEQIPNWGIKHWTNGCGGTTSFLQAVLRAVNIPIQSIPMDVHALAYFPSEGRYLSHGDDPYDVWMNSTPPTPIDQLLIDQAKWDSWFGPALTNNQKAQNIGRRPVELAVEYLPEYLLSQYCDDRRKGLLPENNNAENSSVYSDFKNYYSLAELEDENGINLWNRMNSKLIPTITSITPAIGQVGSYVFVYGANLCRNQCQTAISTETVINLNGVSAKPLWVDKAFLYFQVPAGAATGHISIQVHAYPDPFPDCWSTVVSSQVFTVRDAGKCLTTNCDDGNKCTIDSCDPATGNCTHIIDAWSCDDGNACTTDTCDPSIGCVHTTIADGTSCDDGNACTTGDVCSNGVCVGTAKNCDDGNVCTTDTCDAATGGCIHTNNTLSCNNGKSCSRDVCSGGVCVGTPKNCDDGNVCTTDSCDTATDNCVHTNNTLPCDDGNACTLNDTCSGGICVPGTAKVCNDNNVCTTDTCNPATGCVFTPIVCNDNNACTNDSCDSATGLCVYTPIANCITAIKQYGRNVGDSVYIFGTNLCGGLSSCTSSMSIGFVNAPGIKAPATFGVPGLIAFLIPPGAKTGPIQLILNETILLTSAQAVTVCACDDENVCTTDSCDPVTGACVFTNNTAPCDDGNACTLNDTCSGGICVPGTAKVCNDNNVCTTDTCNPATGCVFTPIVCNDNNACTTDTCNPATGCVYTPVVCNDNDICTVDSCNPATGCVFTPTVPASCNDNNACTTDGCTANACIHTLIVCNDNNACTTDTCNPATGCVFTPIVCNDNNLCTTDACDPATGACVFTLTVPASCNSNDICIIDGCTANACTHTAVVPPQCNDNDICTIDGCTANACTHTATMPVQCNDNDICTTDGCSNNACTHTATVPASCNSNDICIIDGCTANACKHTATVPVQCNDNDICTTDGCSNNACTHTAMVPAQCNDNDICTTDGCSNNSCTHTATVPPQCNDNNACTIDGCLNNACTHTAVVCNDNNTCTTDTCNPASGCVYTSVANGTACTELSNGTCQSGICVSVDLLPTAMTATKSGTTTVLVSETVKNQGSKSAGSFTITYYLSTNTTYESGTDIVLASSSNGTGTCSRNVTSLAPGASNPISNKTCYKPNGAVKGVKYYVLVRDDSGNTVSESNENNNVKATNGTINW